VAWVSSVVILGTMSKTFELEPYKVIPMSRLLKCGFNINFSMLWALKALYITLQMIKKEPTTLHLFPSHICAYLVTHNQNTTRNWPKRNHSLCDYMQLLIICNYIWTFLQLFLCWSYSRLHCNHFATILAFIFPCEQHLV
jgi:hypothetical protein